MFAIQQQGAQGYDIRLALDYILNPVNNYSQSEKEIAAILLQAIKNFKDEMDPYFRVHSKGLGIFCKKKEGIKCNSLIVEYFGEIYQSWQWYERQDILKQG